MNWNRQLRRSFGTVLIITSAALMAGCGGGSKSSSSTSNASGQPSATKPSATAPVASVRIPANLCGLVSGSDISQIMGQSFPAPTSSASEGTVEQDCQSSQPSAPLVAFSLFAGNVCSNGPATSQCLTDRSSTFAANKQTAAQNSKVQDITGLADQAYCAISTTAGITQSVVAVLKGWIYLTATADTCAHAQSLASMLLSKLQ